MSRNIFIDCGANMGQSIENFINFYENSGQYEIYSFECSNSKKIISSINKIIESNKDKCKDITFIKKAVWIENCEMTFYDEGNESSSLLSQKTRRNPTTVQAIDIVKFIEDNFSINDNIILKIDIEGAEYEVLNKLMDSGVIKYINKLYGELHGPKCGMSYTTDLNMLHNLEKHGFKMYLWDATNNLCISDRFYDQEIIYNFHKRYAFKGGIY